MHFPIIFLINAIKYIAETANLEIEQKGPISHITLFLLKEQSGNRNNVIRFINQIKS